MRGGKISRLFSHSIKINIPRLRFIAFTCDSTDVKSFDCGNKDLNDFLCTEEVSKYEEQLFGKTTLVYYDRDLVAYYTLSNSQLRKEYVKGVRGFSKLGEYRIEAIPSITIGRLAVDKNWQRQGIGRVLMQRISMYALDNSKKSGNRLLLVQAKKQAFNFYEKLGFEYVTDTRRERKRFKARGTRTMFFDIISLDYLRVL